MDKAIGYIRVSTQEQTVNNVSLVNQKSAIERYCKDNNLELVQVFEDAGKTAKNANREAFQSALNFSQDKNNSISYFIVWAVDRLSRSTVDHAGIALTLRAANIKLRSVTQNIDETPSGQFVRNILAAVSQFDNDAKSVGVIRGMSKRVLQGGWPSPPPLGYTNTRSPEGIPTLKFTPEAFILRRWFGEYAGKNHTMKEMADIARNMGLKSKSGRDISVQQVRNLLTNRLYAGYVGTDDEGNLIKGIHHPLVSATTYEAIQDRLSGRNKVYNTTDDELWPLRGSFVTCSECGTPITSSTPRGKSGIRFMMYACPRCRASKVGHRVSVTRDKLHQDFVELLRIIRPTEAHLQQRAEHFKHYFHQQMKDTEKEILQHRKELATLSVRRKKVLRLFVDSKLSVNDKDSMLSEIDAQIDGFNKRINSIEMDDSDMNAIVDFVMKVINNLDSTWLEESDTVARKRKMQATIFPEGLTYDFQKGFRTPKTSLLYEVIGSKATNKNKFGTPYYTEYEPVAEYMRAIYKQLKGYSDSHQAYAS